MSKALSSMGRGRETINHFVLLKRNMSGRKQQEISIDKQAVC